MNTNTLPSVGRGPVNPHADRSCSFDNTILGAGEPEETVLVSAGARDGFLARYDAAGDLRWARSFGSASGNELLARIAVSPTGDVLVGGSFDSPLSFDDAVLVPRGSTEGFVVVFR